MDKERYRRGVHTVTNFKYHFVWKTKYGHHVSEGKKFLPVAERISLPAKNILGPSFVVTQLFRSDSGCGVTEEHIKRYIENQDDTPESFKIWNEPDPKP